MKAPLDELDRWRRRTWVLTPGVAVILFLCAVARHWLRQSGAFDLACFDQPLYLLSRGWPPISTIMGTHLLGDHAAWSLWLLVPLYWVWASPLALFGVQATALAAGVYLTWRLALQAGCPPPRAFLLAAAYAAYPLVFNANLFDFHPDAFVPAALLGALLAARANRPVPFLLLCLLAAGCKEVMGLTVAAMGVYLTLFEGRRALGAVAVAVGLGAFVAGTWWLIPAFSGHAPGALGRYAYLGGSVGEVALNAVLAPQRWVPKVASVENLLYLVYLVVPLAWALRGRCLTPLLAAVPALALNLLADYPAQHDVVHQYALPVLPFLMAAAIQAVAADRAWVRGAVAMLAVGFLALAKPGYFAGLYLAYADNRVAAEEAMRRVPPDAALLTTHELAPHLAHRRRLAFTDQGAPVDPSAFQAVLLDVRHPGWRSDPGFAEALRQRVARDPAFHLAYTRDDVYLYQKP